MAEENKISKIKEIENSFDTNPQETTMSEEGFVRAVIVKDVGNVEDVISSALKDQEKRVAKTNEVLIKPPSGSLRRYSTGAIGKLEVQSRYRGNHHVPSTHDLCKHGKVHDHHRDDAVKPWTVVRKTSVEGSVAVKADATSGLRRRSLGSLMSRQIPAGTKVESLVDAKRDALAVKKKPCASVNSETSSVSKMARSVDGSSFRSNDKPRKNKGTETTLSGGSAVVKKVVGLGSEKSSSNVYTPKSLKNKEKAKAQTISGEGLKEKTVCVVEDSVVKDVQSEKKLKASSSEKKTMRSRLKSLTTPTKQVPGTVLTTKKKESGDAELVAKKIRPKKTGVKVTLAKQLSSKKGKTTLEPKLEEQLETQTEVGKKKKKKNLKGVDETRSVSCEASKREKVVLRRRNGQGMKKKMTLFNGVIEETMNKLMKVRKTKVKALIGAFETVISLQDTKTPQSKASTSESQVSTPLR
ncbi:Plant calmodulin-binding protein-related [Raphanus sativus]|uniref:Uncharacterized protein LOC108858314 n=1 Tax=Raphanus sativus TaxID=3726 RepID=A0A6J0NTK2_RAPSA|nr:uncharacterized protein LOC108858314 [Raphanus sativus]KAJ4900326.1 Plant calmodulin-binding protein-related [Raphanus sativus]